MNQKLTMKNFITQSILVLSMSVITVSCGRSSVKINPDLNETEVECVLKTENSLSRTDKIENYTVVYSTLPLSLLESEYKDFRDQVYKARLDYINCIKRGLEQPAQKQLDILKQIQDIILEKDSIINATSPEFLFVLAEVKENTRRDGNLTGYIAVFDPTTLEKVDLLQVTTPLYNNAVMMTEAINGTLADSQYVNQSSGKMQSANPVVNFILQSHPM